jgi:hypothetical protein
LPNSWSHFRKGEQWWLTQEEEQMLEEVNMSHRVVSMVRERILSAIDSAGCIQRSNCPR